MLDNLNAKQKKILGIIGITIFIILGIFFYNKTNTKDTVELNEEMLISNNMTKENTSSEETAEIIVVHITGSVKKPGVVKLPEGSRMEDAIDAAGGLTEDADISNVNLAYILDDGSKIKIPSNTEMEVNMEENIITEENDSDIIDNNQEQKTNTSKGININKAEAKELETLPGIGPSLASRIIEYREENGKFSSEEDIKNVNGIGDNKYENIKDLISAK